jgi:hypothetical protein
MSLEFTPEEWALLARLLTTERTNAAHNLERAKRQLERLPTKAQWDTDVKERYQVEIRAAENKGQEIPPFEEWLKNYYVKNLTYAEYADRIRADKLIADHKLLLLESIQGKIASYLSP